MRNVNIRDARAHLAKLLAAVQAGETVAITRRGQEVARLVPTNHPSAQLPCRTEERNAMVQVGERASQLSTVLRMRGEERS